METPRTLPDCIGSLTQSPLLRSRTLPSTDCQSPSYRSYLAGDMGRQPRQRPISCHFCRLRKLRCSRVFPCTNCASRGLPCPEPLDPQPPAQPAAVQKASTTSVASTADADVLSRLERLEALLVIRNKQSEVVLPSVDGPAQTGALPSGPQLPLPQPLPSDVQNLTADALFLERACLGPKLSVRPSPTMNTWPCYSLALPRSLYSRKALSSAFVPSA